MLRNHPPPTAQALKRRAEAHLAAKRQRYGRELWPNVFTRRRDTERLLGDGDGVLCRLYMTLQQPVFITLRVNEIGRDLGLDPAMAALDALWQPELVAKWKKLFELLGDAPFYAWLETGERGVCHLGVL